MEDQFIRFPVGAEMELHLEAHELGDDEGSALVGTEFVGWLVPNCQRELSITVLRHNNGSKSVQAERAGAVLTEGRFVQSPAGMRVKTMSLTSGSKGATTLEMFPSRSVENEMASRSGNRRSGASGSSNVS